MWEVVVILRVFPLEAQEQELGFLCIEIGVSIGKVEMTFNHKQFRLESPWLMVRRWSLSMLYLLHGNLDKLSPHADNSIN